MNTFNIGDIVKINIISGFFADKVGLVLKRKDYRMKSNQMITSYMLLIDQTDFLYFPQENLIKLNKNELL